MHKNGFQNLLRNNLRNVSRSFILFKPPGKRVITCVSSTSFVHYGVKDSFARCKQINLKCTALLKNTKFVTYISEKLSFQEREDQLKGIEGTASKIERSIYCDHTSHI